jgi:restriction system protein
MITPHIPKSWKDLQNKVGEILQGCGFQVEIEKSIQSVRGSVEIDVYAIEEVDGRVYSVLCECKYWKNNIPQTIIHAFRTVVNDTGCNKGYIITTSKFQKGANESSFKSNVELLTWNEFQNIFFESWYSNFFYSKLNNVLFIKENYHWFDYFDNLNSDDKSLYFSIKNKLDEAYEILDYFGIPYMTKKGSDKIAKLPLFNNLYNENEYYGDFSPEILNECYYENFIITFISYVEPIIKKFNDLHEKYKNQQKTITYPERTSTRSHKQ